MKESFQSELGWVELEYHLKDLHLQRAPVAFLFCDACRFVWENKGGKKKKKKFDCLPLYVIALLLCSFYIGKKNTE